MQMARVDRKVSVTAPATTTPAARDLGLLCHRTDRGPRPTELGNRGQPLAGAFGFVGLTNFSIHQPYRGQLAAHDPRSEEGGSASRIKLPDIVLGPRESLLLPLRIPLTALIPSAPPGLDPADEVYYSTAELTAAGYDGSKLEFQFNTPSDGEIALRLVRRPQTVRLDGTLTRFKPGQGDLLIVNIPRDSNRQLQHTLVLEYRSEKPRIVFQKKDDWISGEANTVQMTILNPGKSPLLGNLFLQAGHLKTLSPLPVEIPAQSERVVKMPLELPPDAPDGLPLRLSATLRATGSETDWSWHSEFKVHSPFTYSLSPAENFPLRGRPGFPAGSSHSGQPETAGRGSLLSKAKELASACAIDQGWD